jgi:putative membrane protein
MTIPDPSPAPPPDAAAAKSGAMATISNLVTKLFAKLAAGGTFSAPPGQKKKTSNDLAEDRTDLAANRTLMAADRSLMAWVRTALSMVSFGFTIYKILQGLQQSGTTLGPAAEPRVVALFLIGVGNLSILMGTMEYWFRAKELSVHGDIPIWRPSFVMAVLIAVLSVFLFFAVIFKVL